LALHVQFVILASAFVTGGQYVLVNFLFAPRCRPCSPSISKSGGTTRALWFRSHCWEHGPSVMVWGQGIWGTEVFQLGPDSRGKSVVWGLVPPVPIYLWKWEHVPPCPMESALL